MGCFRLAIMITADCGGVTKSLLTSVYTPKQVHRTYLAGSLWEFAVGVGPLSTRQGRETLRGGFRGSLLGEPMAVRNVTTTELHHTS